LLLQRPEDVLVLGAWVEKLEMEQVKPPSLPWDSGLPMSRDIDRSVAGARRLALSLNLDVELSIVALPVSLNSENINVCNRLELVGNVVSSIRSMNGTLNLVVAFEIKAGETSFSKKR
jgi:hypothetical protein